VAAVAEVECVAVVEFVAAVVVDSAAAAFR
jgi:hypothetical protein